MLHKDVYEEAIEAIRNVHTDTSVDLEITLDSLSGLRDEITILIKAVEADIRNRE